MQVICRNESIFGSVFIQHKLALFVSVSVDTAERDVKTLVSSGILVPQSGRFRDVSLGIQVSKDILFVSGPVGEDD